MKRKQIGSMILAAAMAFACAGCAGGPSAGGQGPGGQSDLSGTSSSVSSSAPETSPAADPSGADEPGGGAEKMDVTITIDGEDYMVPMSYADFAAKGWAYYDPSAGDAWDMEIQPGQYAWRYFSKGELKALRVYMANPTDSALKFSQCEVIGFEVDYDMYIDSMDAREVVNIPTGSIKINGLGIGEASQQEFAAEFGEATFKDPTDGTYRNGGETYDPCDNDMLCVDYDENAVVCEFEYLLLQSGYMK